MMEKELAQAWLASLQSAQGPPAAPQPPPPSGKEGADNIMSIVGLLNQLAKGQEEPRARRLPLSHPRLAHSLPLMGGSKMQQHEQPSWAGQPQAQPRAAAGGVQQEEGQDCIAKHLEAVQFWLQASRLRWPRACRGHAQGLALRPALRTAIGACSITCQPPPLHFA